MQKIILKAIVNNYCRGIISLQIAARWLIFRGKKLQTQVLICFVSFLLSGCQYQFGRGELSSVYSTISVPYVEGDQRGELTANVIKKLSTSGDLRYVNCGGDLTLKIKLMDFHEENIDFRYDRKKSGKLKKSIIPTETRLQAVAEVILMESATGKTLKGPVCLTVNEEFDHTYYSNRNELNVFSLGQLNDIDAARDAMMQPLNRSLAERIVDYVINS